MKQPTYVVEKLSLNGGCQLPRLSQEWGSPQNVGKCQVSRSGKNGRELACGSKLGRGTGLAGSTSFGARSRGFPPPQKVTFRHCSQGSSERLVLTGEPRCAEQVRAVAHSGTLATPSWPASALFRAYKLVRISFRNIDVGSTHRFKRHSQSSRRSFGCIRGHEAILRIHRQCVTQSLQIHCLVFTPVSSRNLG